MTSITEIFEQPVQSLQPMGKGVVLLLCFCCKENKKKLRLNWVFDLLAVTRLSVNRNLHIINKK